jgi:hypothetical protein
MTKNSEIKTNTDIVVTEAYIFLEERKLAEI